MILKRLTPMLLAAGLICGCSEQRTSAQPTKVATPDNLLLRIQFTGTRTLLTNTNVAYLTQIAGPQTAALTTQLVARAASLPARFLGIAPPRGKEERLEALVTELLRAGFTLELRGNTTQITDFALAAKATDKLTPHWEKAWHEAGKGALTVQSTGGWLFAAGSKTTTASALAEIQKTVAAPGLTSGNVLQVELASSLLPKPVQRSVYGGFSRLKLSVTPANQGLKIHGTATYASLLPKLGAPAFVPAKLITEPVISFTLVRTPNGWLTADSAIRRFLPSPIPHDMVFWGTTDAPFAFYAAVPSPESGQTTRFVSSLAEQLQTLATEAGAGKVTADAPKRNLEWLGVPFAGPNLTESTYGKLRYLVAGLGPRSESTNYAPRELVGKVMNRTNLVLYDWELTGPRLGQWLYISQLALMLSKQQQLGSETASSQWIIAAQQALPQGGNSVTEITQTGPRELTLTRRAPLAFTSVELVWLANWLESANFPAANFLMPATVEAGATEATGEKK